MSPTHGLASTYRSTLYNCRCVPCTKANTDRARDERASRIARLAATEIEHGSASTYQNWGCRCEPCTIANRERCRPYLAAYAERQRALRNPK